MNSWLTVSRQLVDECLLDFRNVLLVTKVETLVFTRDLFITHPTSVPLIDRVHSLPTRGSGHGLVSVGRVGNK